MSDYVPIEYPKWVAGVIVADRAEEDAHMEALTAPAVVDSVAPEDEAAAPHPRLMLGLLDITAPTDPAGTGE